jgi:hypothetical protein
MQPPSLDEAKAQFRTASQAISPSAVLTRTIHRHPAASLGVAFVAGALSVRALPRAYHLLQKNHSLAVLISRWLLRIL